MAAGLPAAAPRTRQPAEAVEIAGSEPMVHYTFCPGGSIRVCVVVAPRPPIASALSLTR